MLIRLYDKLGEVIGNGDYAVISGIIHARAAEVENCYARSFDVVRKEIAGSGRQCCSEKMRKLFVKPDGDTVILTGDDHKHVAYSSAPAAATK
ncbi:MAG: hypothetical protein ACLUSP_05215 [Christensenellales bacterium]